MMTDLTEREQASLASGAYYARWGSGYSTQQASRPQTLGYGLDDSPAFQCAWMVEKFWDWTDCDGHPENVLARDELLDNVMLYWLPGQRGVVGAALLGELPRSQHRSRSRCRRDAPSSRRRSSGRRGAGSRRRFTDLRYFNELERGGHFAAFEQPESFVDEVRSFFRLVRAA